MNDFSNLSSSVVSAAIVDCFYVSQNGIHSSQNSTLVLSSVPIHPPAACSSILFKQQSP